jgi:hypothetical protein
MIKVELIRKAVVVSYDKNVVTGSHATVLAEVEGEMIEKKQIVNHGHATLTYPGKFQGSSKISVIGARGGEDEGVITI